MSATVQADTNLTYWGGCSFGDSSVRPWRLEWKESSGYIAISTRAFQAGDLICAETPTTSTKSWHPFTEAEKNSIEDEVQLLPKGRINSNIVTFQTTHV